jgi:hypothetical protein
VRARHVLERGELVGGRIVGIHIGVRKDPDTSAKYPEPEYAIEVHAATSFVAGVRQHLSPNNIVRLGMDVAARHVGREAVIDWHATCGGQSGDPIKLLSKPPARGIVDDFHDIDSARRKWTHADCTILGAQRRHHHSLLGMRHSLHLDLGVQAPGMQPFSIALDKVSVPTYAAHLYAPGTRLPVWVRPGHSLAIEIDWAEAAMAFPGVGWPPSQVLDVPAG